ncbi:hypothetical protein A2U01_0037597, partial [Trifolium medium]|nr:hypothetical protein [Trifolium medium]
MLKFNYASSPIDSGNGLNMYLNPRVHSSIPTEDKNSTREGVEKIVIYSARPPTIRE